MPIMKDVTSHAPTTVAALAGAAVVGLVAAQEVAVVAQVASAAHAPVDLEVPVLVAKAAADHVPAAQVARDEVIFADHRVVHVLVDPAVRVRRPAVEKYQV